MAVTERPINIGPVARKQSEEEIVLSLQFKDGRVQEVPFHELQAFIRQHRDELVKTKLQGPVLC